MKKIIVIGAGVNGLATAYTLLKAGHNVTVAAESFSPNTVSNAAAAVWKPYSSEESERAGLWSKVALNALLKHASDPTSGITPLWVNQVGQTELPWWSAFVPQETTEIHVTKAIIEGKEVPNCRYRSVVADMTIYMPWLMNQCKQAGIQFKTQSVDNLEDMLKDYDAAVVCTGGNKKLCPDDKLLRPLTGVVLVYPGRLTDECWSRYGEPDKPTYINPRSHTTIVGGTALLSAEELTPEFLEQTKIAIRRRAIKLVPSLAKHNDCQIMHADRPFRLPTVRLEKTMIGGKTVVYNYGHGGAGVTFSWGCAMEASILLAENLNLEATRQTVPLPRLSLAGGWQAVTSLPISLTNKTTPPQHNTPIQQPAPPPPGLNGQN